MAINGGVIISYASAWVWWIHACPMDLQCYIWHMQTATLWPVVLTIFISPQLGNSCISSYHLLWGHENQWSCPGYSILRLLLINAAALWRLHVKKIQSWISSICKYWEQWKPYTCDKSIWWFADKQPIQPSNKLPSQINDFSSCYLSNGWLVINMIFMDTHGE